MNRRIRRLGIGLVALFGLLFMQVSYIQVFAANGIAGNAANARRQIIAEYKVERGQIITADGTVIALSTPTGANASLRYARHYPQGPLFAGITGYYSQIYGRTELEQAMNSYLSGDAPELAGSTLADLVLGRPKKGGHVITTIDARLQQVASDALGSLPGAVVALDPRSGDILAMVSNPTFDPNELSSQDPAAVQEAWKRLNADPRTPLLSRANDELFPPGSTFKMVTASAALENGYGLDSTWPNPHELDLPLTNETIQNFGGEGCPGGATTTLLTAFTSSCNVIFGEVGLKLGAQKLADQAHAFGFCPTDPPGQTGCIEPTIPFVIPFATGRFPVASYFEGNEPLVAISAIGQDNDLANPLQMALVASAIANGGEMMNPRLVTEIRDPQGRIIKDVPSPAVRAADLGVHRRRHANHDGERRDERDRHRRTDPRRGGSGQDRDRAARRARHRPARVVRLLRAGGAGRGPRRSRSRLSSWTAATSGARPPEVRWRRRSRSRSSRRTSGSPDEGRGGLSASELGGRYRVEARIGSGGMGEVYRGVDTVLDRTVAIKILLPQFARDANFVDRFRREAQAAARLNHPNLVGIYDSGADGETQFIVMEFIEGRTLEDFMSSGGRFDVGHAVEVAEKICEALAYAHVAGVIHRDIKPANVMVTRQGEVKVMDFGIARIVAGPQTAPQTSAVLGTAAYISPEQAQGQPVDGRSDIYSLGAVLYEMLTGRPPFTGDSPVAVAYKQVNESPVLPSIANPAVTPLLDAVLMRALAKNPANRYQTADEFRADLERARLGQDVLATPLMPAGGDATQVISRPQATAILPPQESPPGSGRKVWLGVLIGIIAVAVLAGAGYLLAQGLLGNKDDTTTPVPVPTVIGFTQDRAIQELESVNLKAAVKSRVSATVKPGRVVDQDPVAGTTLAPGSTVTIFVAKAPPTVVVPTFTGLTLDAAQTLANANHLVLRPTDGVSDTVPVGSIISQDPPPGGEVQVGSEVAVVVSAPPATVTVDDVTCLSFGAAKAALRDQGLVAVLGGTAPLLPQCPNPNRIAMQDPAAGATVDVGSTVTLFTGEAESPTGPTGTSGPTA